MSAILFVIESGINYEGAMGPKVATTTLKAAQAIADEIQALIDENKQYDYDADMDGQVYHSHWDCPTTGARILIGDWVKIRHVSVIG